MAHDQSLATIDRRSRRQPIHDVLSTVQCEDHGPEPRILNSLGVLPCVLCNIRLQPLRQGRRHLQDFPSGVSGETLLVEPLNETSSYELGVEVYEAITLVSFGAEIYGKIEEVEGTLKASSEHLCDELFCRISVRQVS